MLLHLFSIWSNLIFKLEKTFRVFKMWKELLPLYLFCRTQVAQYNAALAFMRENPAQISLSKKAC